MSRAQVCAQVRPAFHACHDYHDFPPCNSLSSQLFRAWELSVNPIQGTRLIWKIPSQSLIRDILRNPFYAGAYVWGRRPVTTLLVGGRLEKRQSAMRPAEECRVFIRDHHVGYIEWATYEENQRMIRRNSVNWEGDESMAAIRAGQGLLVGLLRCGHCGRKLHVRY